MGEIELSKFFLTKKIPYVKPFWSIDVTSESEILDWFREARTGLNTYYNPLFAEQKENLALFLGAGVNPNWASPYTQIYASTVNVGGDNENIFINDIYRLVNDQVSLVVSHELVPDVLPNSDEFTDKVSCNATKEWLESMSYTLGMEEWRFRIESQTKIFGECFIIPLWNPNIGDLHPLAKKYINEDVDMVDDEGNVVTDIKQNPVKLRKNTRIGDIEFINPMPWNCMMDPAEREGDSCWFWWEEYIDVEYLKREYPKLDWSASGAGKGPGNTYDTFSNTEKENPNKRMVTYLIHKSHKFLPEGRYVVLTVDHVLINKPLEMPTIINNQDLPQVHFKDIDVGLGTRGIPLLMRNIKNLSEANNHTVNQMYNNLEMESPKLLIHEDSGVDAQRMPTGCAAFEWHGQHEPKIIMPTTNTSSIFNFQQMLVKNMDQVALQNPLVKGETPNAQLDSFVALQYFEDQRNQLAAQAIKSHIRGMEQLYRLMITIARDMYTPDDGRLIKILGKHNSYQLKYFDPINLQKSYDVHIMTTGNLANSKAARTQMLLSIKREFPGMLTDEVFADMLGLSHSKKFMNAITSAVSSAESENADMMNGQPVLSPARYEDLITHWDAHRIPMQTMDFKHSPLETQELFIGHVAATEKLMYEQAAENPVFAARLEQLRQFPMFYTPKPVNEQAPMPMDGMEEPVDDGQPPLPEETLQPEMTQ
jgi:hypothetical protein